MDKIIDSYIAKHGSAPKAIIIPHQLYREYILNPQLKEGVDAGPSYLVFNNLKIYTDCEVLSLQYSDIRKE